MVDFNRLLKDCTNAKLLRTQREMAKPTVNAAPTDNENDPLYTQPEVPEMPEEFADDPNTPVPYTPSVSPTASLSEDEFGDKGFNDAQDELELAKLNPPTGDWKKEDSWEYERQVFADDSMPGDFDSNGRTFLVFKGKPVAREANGLQYEPSLRLRVSPDKRFKLDKPTEVDTAYKLFLKAKDMYIEKHSEKPSKMSQYVSMLQHDAYILRTMNGDNGSIIVEVKLKSYQGRNSR